jgi:hypothetical protein
MLDSPFTKKEGAGMRAGILMPSTVSRRRAELYNTSKPSGIAVTIA